MINGLMTRAQFEDGINSNNPFARRPTSLIQLAQSIENAHQIPAKPAQFIALLGLRKFAYDWKVEHKTRTGKSWRTTNRSQGVMALEIEIAALFNGAFNREFSDFKQRLNTKMARTTGTVKALAGIGKPNRPQKVFPNSTRQLSTAGYFLEFLEPKHRADAQIMKGLWDDPVHNPGLLSFGEFVDQLDPALVKQIDKGYDNKQPDEYNWVKYLTQQEADQLELKPVAAGNLFKRDADDENFDTSGHRSSPHRSGWSIFVMDENNRIYTESKNVKKFHHSSFLGGTPTKSAGTLKVNKGRIVGITMASGHYAPGPTQALAICRALLAKFSANSGAVPAVSSSSSSRSSPPNFKISQTETRNSRAAQNLLDKVYICPDFENIVFYNALSYLKAGGQVAGLPTYKEAQVV